MNAPSFYGHATIGGRPYPPFPSARVDAIREAVETLALRGVVVLPSHVELKILEATRPAPNGIRVVHKRLSLARSSPHHWPRWISTSATPTRVRTCRGSRR